jgi:hypothetical protein
MRSAVRGVNSDGFDQRPVASGKRRHERHERELHRIVPGADDAHEPQGHPLDASSRAQVLGRQPHPLRPQPALEPAQGPIDSGQDEGHVREHGLGPGPPAEVGIQSLRQRLGTGQHGRPERSEMRAPLLEPGLGSARPSASNAALTAVEDSNS